jgi:methylaspartate mutase sigma subunit
MFNTRNLVLGVIGSDVHVVGNRILDHALKEHGFSTENLGIQISQDELIEAAIETNAAAILVSSLYGHAEIDCRGLRERCIERGIGDVLLYVGGNLVVGKRDFAEVESQFLNMGFTRVFPPATSPDIAIAQLESDLAELASAGER